MKSACCRSCGRHFFADCGFSPAKTGAVSKLKTNVFRLFARICIFDKIGIEIVICFVYNVFIVVFYITHDRWRANAFPKGELILMYTANSIRNICLLGHSGSGKTALAESLLYMTGAIDRIGKNADGNTVCDYDPEEIKRNISISTAVVPLDYKGARINLLDAPGGFDFSGAVVEALRAADAAILVCSAKDGITVGFEKAWKYCEERNMPRFVYISKVDEDNSDYNATFEALREKYGNKIAPVVVPIWDSSRKVTGIIDVLNKRAYEMQNLKRVEIEVPEGKDEVITEFNDALKESVAETSEELMDKFFGGEDFTYAEMIKGMHTGVLEQTLYPVLCGSGVNCLGSLSSKKSLPQAHT